MAKVYLSSTIVDLESERRAVLEWLRAARHQAVDSYLPDSETVRESCLNDIDHCDLYVLILGHRYGFQPVEENPEKLSITHLEFRRAGESGIPRIALLRTSIPEIKLSDMEDPQRAPLVIAFRSEVQSQVRPAEFKDLSGLIQGLSTGVQSELDKLHSPSKRQRTEVWLAEHLQEVAEQFTSHMAASVLKSDAPPADHYLDLVVAERHLGMKGEASSENKPLRKEGRSLEEVLNRAQAPLLLIGEGGAGKTTSLLYIAARAADRAKSDLSGVVPIYVNLARLTKLEDTADLYQLIADSVPLVKDWDELSELGIFARRRILFLFDSFNEIPEHLQRTGAVILSRFIEKQKKDHLCLLGSRLVPHIEQLSHPPSQFKTFEILRLTPEQVQSFLQGLGLGSLYDRMPSELRELAGNPFMLLAIARTLAGKSESTLPRNRGKLYQSFASEWMAREGQKQRGLSYSYERVKEPLLAYLAKRMTSAGQTLLVRSNIEAGVETELKEIYQNIERRGGMPKDWTVDHCLNEILRDGLLKQVNDQVHFMHQSVQEYFTSIYFSRFPEALLDLTPKLVWEFVTPYALAEVPAHRFVPTLLMMSGLLDDSTKIVEALAARNPILAAAAISSADRVDRALLAKLEESWLELLEHDDLPYRIVGCSCLVTASMRSPRVVQRLVAFALGSNFDNSYVGTPALGKLGAHDLTLFELTERARNLPEDEYNKLEHKIGDVINVLQSARTVQILFEQWRTSPPDSSVRRRFESLLATVDASLFKAELQRIQFAASDPAVSAEAAKALAAGTSWEKAGGIISASKIRQAQAQAQKQYTDRTAKTLTAMRDLDDRELVANLRSSDPSIRAAAAALAAERHAPVGDDILAAILRFDHYYRSQGELISALVGLWGEQTTVAKLLEGSEQKCRCVGSLNPDIALQLNVGEIPEAVTTEIERLGVQENLLIEQHDSKGENSIWTLVPSSWSPYRSRYELRGSPGRLELYDCNMAVRAFIAVARIPGEASINALQSAVEHPDLDVRKIVIRKLAEQGDPSLAVRLLAQLRSAKSADFIDTALEALGILRRREALSLMDDLLVLTDEEWSDRHPVWGPCPHSPGWGASIHRTLVGLSADSHIQQVLDKTLAAEDSGPKVSALHELARWFEENLDPERQATWRTPERLQQLLRLALSDPNESVRTTAGKALEPVKSEFVQKSLADALTNNEAELQVAAAEALVRIQEQELYPQVSEVMLQVANSNQAPETRRRAAKVLTQIPEGVEPFYRPIQAELERGAWESALELITGTLEIIPDDVNLFWWRGYVLRSLGRLDEAANSYQHAYELENRVQVIPQALAQTFVELGDYKRAMETARLGVQIAADNAEAQAILAWSSYKAGAIQDAVRAASLAVDLDPTHSYAIWVVLLGHLRQMNAEESRSAFKHAITVRQLLAPDLDTSSLTNLLQELDDINTDNDEISRLMKEIRDGLAS